LTDAVGALMRLHVGSEENAAFRLSKENYNPLRRGALRGNKE
jgi:hypothetical protein